MKMLYGVHGYGRGHAMRALAVLPELTARHDILVLAGSDAYNALATDYDVVRIPTLRYAQNPGGKRSTWRTIKRNLPGVLDLKANGPALDMVADEVRRFAPEVIVSDSEPWTHHAAAAAGVPRISFDHFAVLVHCDWPMSFGDRMILRGESFAYNRLMGRPERMVVASFFDAPPKREGVRVVGPVLRKLVSDTEPTDGDHLLVYFTNGRENYSSRVHEALGELDLPVLAYGAEREGREGAVEFRPLSNTRFVEDLASCRAIFSTAGNQLISEAMHFGKPLLLMPEDALEQRLNAQTVERLAFGLYARRDKVSAALIRRFLDGRDRYAANLRAAARNGQAEAVAAIEQYAAELA